jgi:hypothetical protein
MDSNGEATAMLARIRSHVTSNAIAYLALFFALSGGAYAVTTAPPNSVVTKSIKNRAVTKKKLHKGSVTTSKFAPSAIAPRALNADNADLLGGSPPSDYQRAPIGSCINGGAIEAVGSDGTVACATPVKAIREFPRPATPATDVSLAPSPLTVLDICHDGTTTEVLFRNDGSAGTLNWIYSNGATTVNANGVNMPSGAEQTFSFAGARLEGQFIFANPNGVTTVNLHAFDAGSNPNTGGCEMTGTSEFAPK